MFWRRERDSNPQVLANGDFRGRCLTNSAHLSFVRPLRIELRSTVPQTAILSVKLWARTSELYQKIDYLFVFRLLGFERKFLAGPIGYFINKYG